jgi:hypothetical protein
MLCLRGIGLAGGLAVALSLGAGTAAAQEGGVKVGFLSCDVSGDHGFIVGSMRDVDCTFAPNEGASERYVGEIDKWGIDIGYIDAATIVWVVVAPTYDVAPGALAGDYGGVTGGFSFGIGLGANVLFGGSAEPGQIALQPVSFEGSEGLNIAAGVATLSLAYVAPPPPVEPAAPAPVVEPVPLAPN